MMFLRPSVRLRLILVLAVITLTISIFLGKAVGQEVNRDAKTGIGVESLPGPRDPAQIAKLKRIFEALKRRQRAEETARWLMKKPRKVDETDRLVPTDPLWDWWVENREPLRERA